MTHNTIPLVHLSEVGLWDNPHQIDDALMPAIPPHARTFVVFESSAKGRGTWWHQKWLAAKKGLGRLTPVFLPWYLEPQYRKPAPPDWRPSEIALAHAKKAEETSPTWCRGTRVTLTRDQLYWWEFMRADYAERNVLYKFLAEFAADDSECFQNTSASVFPAEVLHELYQHTREPSAIVHIRPRVEMTA